MRHDEARPRKRRRPPTRRKTVRWSPTEVEALLAGVRLHGVGKWATILRHSKVFNGVRTSVDLKDKWRNLPSPARAAALAATCASICKPEASGTLEPPTSRSQETDNPQQREDPPVPSSPAQSRSQTPDGENIEESGGVSETERHTNLPDKADLSTDQRVNNDSMEDTSAPATPVMNQDVSVSDFVTPALATNGIAKTTTRPVAPVPLAPSESSVSPEALSAPHPASNTPSTTIGTPVVYPPHPSPFASPYPGGVNPVHVATVQHAMQQGLYQSAAAIAAYWRSLGHEPDPYAIAATLTGGNASGFYGGGVEGQGNVEEDEEEDDDEDDEDDPTDVTPFSISALGVKGPMPVTGPMLVPFGSPYTNPFTTASPMLHGGIIAPATTPNLPIPETTSRHLNAARDGSDSEDGIGTDEPDDIEIDRDMPIGTNSAHNPDVESNVNSSVQAEVNKNQRDKTMSNSDNENLNGEKEVLLLSGEDEPVTTDRDEMDVESKNAEAGESLFSVHDFPEKGPKDPDKTNNSDEDISGSNSLEINPIEFPQNTGVPVSYSATDY